MKNLSLTGKIILLFTWLSGLLLFLAFVAPHISPHIIPQLSLLSLAFPILVLINMLLLIYWLVNLKKYVFIPLLVLMINYNNLHKLYQWRGKHSIEGKGISLMSYNVRLFNDYKQIKRKAVDVDISNFLKDQNPDILLLQEFRPHKKTDFSQYKYKYLGLKGKRKQMGVAVFSKYPIIDKGNFDFKNTYNNAIWVDLKIGKDTLRIYNVHMQSHSIHPERFDNSDKAEISNKITKVFELQYDQAKIIQSNMETVKHKIILGGDFNNTAFSSTYNILKQDRYDAFVEAGKGFGFSWRYKFLPFRIDFLLVDKAFFVRDFITMDNVKFSDHYPIKTLLKIK